LEYGIGVEVYTRYDYLKKIDEIKINFLYRERINNKIMMEHIIIMDCEANTGESIPKDKIDMIQIAALNVEQSDTDFKIVGRPFTSFCRPRNFPILTEHIKKLTGIDQSLVDNAPIYPNVMDNFKKWRHDQGLPGQTAVPAFSGDWDMNSLLPYEQSRNKDEPMDSFFKKYINLKNAFAKLHPAHLTNTKPPEIVKDGKNYGRLGTESLMEYYNIKKLDGSQDHQADWDVQHIFLVMQSMHREGYRWTESDFTQATFMDTKYTGCHWD